MSIVLDEAMRLERTGSLPYRMLFLTSLHTAMRKGEMLVGTEWAKLAGKHIGRPRVIDQEGFLQRFREVVNRIGEEGISRSQAAREVNIGYITFKRLLDAN